MKIILLAIPLLAAIHLQGQTDVIRQKHYNLEKGNLAIQGYDPVSYFNNPVPLKGDDKLELNYRGLTYRFANAKNLALFKAQPEKYEPAWGGWCGHAMAQRGAKVEINPECYKIIDGRNVLFYRTVWANALKNWNGELKTTPEPKLMNQGDHFWNEIINPE